jgi:hypothetical protein
VFLDSPFPENLPIVPACWACNNSFSRDEEYVACLIESAVAGSSDPGGIRRPRVAHVLRRSPALRSRIEAGKYIENGRLAFSIDTGRVQNVILKLARGHAAYELSSPCRQEPTALRCWPICVMTDDQRDDFDASHVTHMFGEVGSRAIQRMLVTQLTLNSPTGESSSIGVLINDWIDVQDGRYRYLAIDDGGEIRIKIVIAEYLACEVSWIV